MKSVWSGPVDMKNAPGYPSLVDMKNAPRYPSQVDMKNAPRYRSLVDMKNALRFPPMVEMKHGRDYPAWCSPLSAARCATGNPQKTAWERSPGPGNEH